MSISFQHFSGCLFCRYSVVAFWGSICVEKRKKEVGQQLSKALVTTYFHFSDCLYLPHMKMATSWYDKRKHTKWDYAMHPVRKGKLYS